MRVLLGSWHIYDLKLFYIQECRMCLQRVIICLCVHIDFFLALVYPLTVVNIHVQTIWMEINSSLVSKLIRNFRFLNGFTVCWTLSCHQIVQSFMISYIYMLIMSISCDLWQVIFIFFTNFFPKQEIADSEHTVGKEMHEVINCREQNYHRSRKSR